MGATGNTVVQTVRLQKKQLPQDDRTRATFLQQGQWALSLFVTSLTVAAYATVGVAQVPGSNEADVPTETPVNIPVEVVPDDQTDSLTGGPSEGTIEIPTIVPIPSANPPELLFPPPGLREGTIRDENTYTLGPGDQIVIDIFDVPEFSGDNGTYTLLVDGSVILPWIGRVPLQGLTLEEAAARLEQLYGGNGYIVNPLITVNLDTARSLKVSVVGEIKRPGAYSISPTGDATAPLVAGDDAGGGGDTDGNGWPTVTQAIQAAGGITQLADLRNVQIRRSVRDGSEELISINLWDLIRSGKLEQDISLRDGDVIVIPTAADLSSDEAILTGSASFAPGVIQVNVVGEVIEPGVVEVPANTSLNQAIQVAGGFERIRARTSRVELIRLNPNGTAVRRTIPTDFAAGINEESNPALREGDTIVVTRNSRTSFIDTVGQVLEPVGNFLGILSIFNLFD